MSYRIQYGKEPKSGNRHVSLMMYQFLASVLLCLSVTLFSSLLGENTQLLHHYFIPEATSAEAVFARAVSDGQSLRSAAVHYCRQLLRESGYEP